MGTSNFGAIGKEIIQHPIPTVYKIFSEPLILLSIPLYIFSFLLWVIALSRLNLSFAYPFLAISYIIVPIAAHIIIGETTGVIYWLGVAFILVGVFFVIVAK